jgi:hypothetical protein
MASEILRGPHRADARANHAAPAGGRCCAGRGELSRCASRRDCLGGRRRTRHCVSALPRLPRNEASGRLCVVPVCRNELSRYPRVGASTTAWNSIGKAAARSVPAWHAYALDPGHGRHSKPTGSVTARYRSDRASPPRAFAFSACRPFDPSWKLVAPRDRLRVAAG